MGNCPASRFNEEEDEPVETEENGWSSEVDYPSSSRKKTSTTTRVNRLWEDYIVPYEIDRSLDFIRDRIKKAMENIEQYSRFQFVRRSYQYPFLEITRENGCYFANAGSDHPKISIGDGCESYRTILHELLHALEFPHEHKRPDRDEYVVIHWENIRRGHESQFKRLEYGEYPWMDLPFDYDSIMLYSSYTFSKNRRRTIETVDGKEIPRHTSLSAIDKEKLSRF